MTLVVNLFGGPGTGKSTTAAGVFSELKQRGFNAELVTEYAKDRVWDKHFAALDNQIYIFGKQYHRIHRLLGQVEVIVTDAPLLLSLYYGDKNTPESFKQLVRDIHGRLINMNVFLNRKKEYNPVGRMQTEEQARDVDGYLGKILDSEKVNYIRVDADRSAINKIADIVDERLTMAKKASERPFRKFVEFPISVKNITT